MERNQSATTLKLFKSALTSSSLLPECSNSVTTLTCDGGVNVLFFNQQVSGALWEPGQHHQLDEGGHHHHGEEQGPVLVLEWRPHSNITMQSVGCAASVTTDTLPC